MVTVYVLTVEFPVRLYHSGNHLGINGRIFRLYRYDNILGIRGSVILIGPLILIKICLTI